MNRKRVIGIAVAVIGCAGIALAGTLLSEKKAVVILDAEETVIGKISYEEEQVVYDCDEAYRSYVDIVWKEAVEAVTEKERAKEETIKKEMVREEWVIRTRCNQELCEQIQQIYNGNQDVDGKDFAVAVSDTKGHMIASYSNSRTIQNRNLVTEHTYAGSTMKPLSVYGPAIADDTIHWSSLFLDDAYMQITDKDGKVVGWPTNTEPYSKKLITVEEALAKSNNAVAVRVLKDVGAERICEFLKEEMSMELDVEIEKLKREGEDSVLSNLALGYLQNGISVQQMLENYQVFANGGKRYPLHTIVSVEDQNGKVFFRENEDEKRVFDEATAYVVNRLLKKVVEEGTGIQAKIDEIDVCGKTGTSERYQDNWFIGMTPEYVCAVWYSDEEFLHESNEAVPVFKEIIQNLNCDEEVSYTIPEEVTEEAYCLETGLVANKSCQRTKMGYYKRSNMPEVCDCK